MAVAGVAMLFSASACDATNRSGGFSGGYSYEPRARSSSVNLPRASSEPTIKQDTPIELPIISNDIPDLAPIEAVQGMGRRRQRWWDRAAAVPA
jgi:hypothetical protein